jgi:WD40 repeat protein
MFSNFLEVKYPVTSMRWRPERGFSKTQNILVDGCADGTIKYWHTTSGKLIHTYTEEGNGVYCIDYNYDGTKLVSGGSDTFVRVYDDATKELIHTFNTGGAEYVSHYNRIFSVKFDPYDDRLIYSGGWDKIINVNDTREKKPVSQIIGPYLSADTLDVNNTDLLVGNYDSKNPIEIYDLKKSNKIKSIPWKSEDGKPGGNTLGAMFSKPDAEAIIA